MEQGEGDKKQLEDFSLIVVLGKGTYGKVVLVKEKTTGEVFAMKILKKKHIEKKKQINHVITERNVLVSIKHPFIVKLHYSFQNPEKLFFVMEYCHGGELFNLLAKRRKFTEDQTRFYAAQIILAIEKLHENNIIYRDLKPENVLIDLGGYIKIADFGLSKGGVTEQDAKSVCGTPEYLAPEILCKLGHGKPVDYWALGAIIYEMLTGLPPFYKQSMVQVKGKDGKEGEEQSRELLFENIKTSELPMPSNLTKPCLDLLKKLFQKNPNKRLGFNGATEVKEHPWFMNVNWQILLKKQYKPPYVPVVQDQLDTQHFDKEFTECPIDSYKQGMGDDDQERQYIDFSYMGSKTEPMLCQSTQVTSKNQA